MLKPFMYMGFAMGVFFAFFGVAVFLNPPDGFNNNFIPPNILGVLIFLYGGYRFYRSYLIYKKLKETPPNESDENENHS